MDRTETQPQQKGSDQQEGMKFKRMNINEFMKPAIKQETTPAQPQFPDFSAMNPAMAQFPFSMFAGMNAMNGFPGLPFQGFGFPFMMPQPNIQPKSSHGGHNSKKTFNQPMISLDNYSDEKLIREKFDCLRDMNDPKFKVDTIKDADFFIIRSSNDDDFHKAVKYGIWSSSQKNNHAFQDAYQASHRKDGKSRPVYFFFTVVNSDQYIGVAQMVSDVDFAKSFGFWWEKTKWTGVFRIKWIFVKDIAYSQFSNVSSGDKLVTQHRDGTKLDFDVGLKMLKVFEQTKTTESIFNDFQFMDEREEKMRLDRSFNDTAVENDKPSSKHHGGHRGDGGHRHHRGDRDRDRDGGHYRKKNNDRYNSGSEYQPKRREGGNRREPEEREREDHSEEKPFGIIIQKKAPKQKRYRGKNNNKDRAGETNSKETTTPAASHQKIADQNTANKTVDVPTSDA